MTDQNQFKLAITRLKFVEMDVGSSIAACWLNTWESYLRRKDRGYKFAALLFLRYCCFQVRWGERRWNRMKGGFTPGITNVDSASRPSQSGCETQHKRESVRDGEHLHQRPSSSSSDLAKVNQPANFSFMSSTLNRLNKELKVVTFISSTSVSILSFVYCVSDSSPPDIFLTHPLWNKDRVRVIITRFSLGY